jgi:hypothetical protein
MPDETIVLPVGFYIALAVTGVGMVYAWTLRMKGIGLPMMAVLGTVGAWYFGDALYNDYADYISRIGADMLDLAWGQVCVFVFSFCFFSLFMYRWINKDLLGFQSHILTITRWGGLENPLFQHRLDLAMRMLTSFWIGLMLIAMVRTNFDFMGMFAPYISGKAYPWSRGRVGGGFDAVVAFFSYFHIMLVSAIGVILALSKNARTRSTALVLYVLSVPWFILDRVRNLMLAVILPGLLAWVFIRFRGGIFLKVAILLASFLAVNAWMKFVIQVRSEANVALLFQEVGIAGVSERLQGATTKHAGLNMFEELGWVNSFIEKGTFQPNMGSRYFAELVNPIPRVIWRDKPMIGIDYAIARGQRWEGGDKNNAGVGATISTGFIGQGVVNFGRFFGPIAAALIMAAWAALLARQDLQGDQTGRLLLLLVGLVLTFNLGRDITLITLYPFFFGLIMVNTWRRIKGER